MRTLITTALVWACIMRAPGLAQTDEKIDADRPHVGTGTHVVPVGQVQFELGGQYQSFGSDRTFGSPVLMRVGVSDRVEARLASDGLVGRSGVGATQFDLGNVQIAAKIRVLGHSDEPWLSLLPGVNLGLASESKGLGSGANDASLIVLLGRALTERAHVEANYGIGNLGDASGARFAQHLVTAAVTHDTTRSLTTYVEGAWWSRQEADGTAVSFLDYGVIYALTAHVLIDGGALNGLTRATADYGVFAGLSFIIGEPRRGVMPRAAARFSTR
jgi:hypothetical protein